MAAIETTGLTREFGDLRAVDELDLTVEDGEIYGFLGPNGAGKSTTINVLLGFLDPTAGSATVLGHDVESDSLDLRQRIGVLPEDFEPYARLTAREHVDYAAGLKDASPDVDALLERVGLQRAAWDRAAGDYSTGMAKRLALATALVGEPELLILDEPSSGLDPDGMAELRALVREEAAGGTTVFFSSHILSEVEAVCDRVGILVDGALATSGTLEELRAGTETRVPLSLDVETVPAGIDGELRGMDGVVAVAVEDATITVELDDRRRKIDVIAHVGDRTTVVDIVAERASLEAMFQRYASGARERAGRHGDAGDERGRRPMESGEVDA